MSRLALYFLGVPHIERDGSPVAISHPKATVLLAYLAVNRWPHRREALAAFLYPTFDPESARGEVRRLLWQLNSSLGKGWLVATRQNVALPQHADLWMDVEQFHRLLEGCLRHGHAPTAVCPHCINPLTKAVELVRGDFLATLSIADSPDFENWQTIEAQALRNHLSSVLERLIQLHLPAAGAGDGRAISYAQRWLALDPLNEAAHRQLMQLYTWSGQPGAALRQYQSCVQTLREEVNLPPAADTTALYEAIVHNRLPPPSACQALPEELQASSPPGVAPLHPLPAQLTPFIGRQREVTAVCELLLREEVQLLTMTGPGGIGKTRLALEVAASVMPHFEHGVVYVPLADLRDPALVPTAIAQQVQVQAGGSQPLLELLKHAFHAKQMLLVLDNFEHVVSAAPILAELLAAAPQKVLVTSRVPLNLRGEHEYLVPPLELPPRTIVWSLERLYRSDAFQLFVARAQAARADFVVSGESALTIAEICDRLEGLPLAIELAAARVKLLPPAALLARLGSALRLLTGGAQDLPARQQTMRSTIEWSYQLLSPEEQVLFARLAVFVGGFSLEAAEAICSLEDAAAPQTGDDPNQSQLSVTEVLEGITALLNNSLLTQAATKHGHLRLRMFEMVREYAQERLQQRGEMARLQRRHAHYFAEQLAAISLELFADETNRRLDWVEDELDNLRATLAWCSSEAGETETAWRMAGDLCWFWYRRGYLNEGRDWCRKLSLLGDGTEQTSGCAMLLWASGSLAMMQGDLEQAGPLLDESIVLWRALGEEHRLHAGLTAQGVLALYQGELTAAQRYFEESLAITQACGLHWFSAHSLMSLANVALAQGDYETARVRLESTLATVQDSDYSWLSAVIWNNLGEVARASGDYQQARVAYETSQTLFRQAGDKADVARSQHSLAYVTQHLGDEELAAALFHESLTAFQEMGNQRGITECLAGLAGLAAQCQPRWAARLLAAAERHLTAAGGFWWPADQVEYNRNLATIRSALDEATFVAAWSEGQAMTLEQAISFARQPSRDATTG